MSNSPLVVYTKLSPNHSGKRTKKIDTITIHCMAGNCSVETCGNLFANSARQASSNYGIGTDGRIALYVDEANRSWCTSSNANDQRAVTIEVANNGGAPDWAVSAKAYAALLDLVTDICKRNGIKRLVWSTSKNDRVNHLNGCNMTVHRDYANKSCPGDYLYNRHGQIAAEVNKRLGITDAGGSTGGQTSGNTETGLKEKGFEFLAEMERLHIIADVSHLSDKGFWDIAEHSTRPFAASHSNCRALAPHCRNLTDEMIRVMAEKGGLVGLNYCAGFLDDQPSPDLCRSTTALMAKHAAHFKQVGGIEIIGLGSDFDGIGGKLELSDCSRMPLLADALRKEGFTEDEVEAIFFRNAQRFFENNL